MSQDKSTPAPTETGPGQQMDDNVDDLGNKKGGEKLDQPGAGRAKVEPKPDKE